MQQSERLWTEFNQKLETAGTTLDAIQHCSEDILKELMSDLGFQPDEINVICGTWKRKFCPRKEPQSKNRVAQKMPKVRQPKDDVSEPILAPVAYHSAEFENLVNQVMGAHDGPSGNWRLVAADRVVRDEKDQITQNLDASIPIADIVMVAGERDLNVLFLRTEAMTHVYPLNSSWSTRNCSTNSLRILVGRVPLVKTLVSQTDRITLDLEPEPKKRGTGGVSTAMSAPSAVVPVTSITPAMLHRSGFQTISLLNEKLEAYMHYIQSPEQLVLEYLVTVEQFCVERKVHGTASGENGADGSISIECAQHPSHFLEFWNPVQARLTCAICHLSGSSVHQPGIPIDRAAKDVDLDRNMALVEEHSRTVQEAQELIHSTIEQLDTECRTVVNKLEETVQNIQRALMERRDEIRSGIEAQYSSHRRQLHDTEKKIAQTRRSLTDLKAMGRKVSTPMEIMRYRYRVLQSLQIQIPRQTSCSVSVDCRPVSWVDSLAFHTQVKQVELPLPESCGEALNNQVCLPGVVDLTDTGLIEWLGTDQGRSQTFNNPHSAGLIRLTSSVPFVVGDIELLAGRERKECRTKSAKGAWIMVDFGEEHALICTGYTLYHGHEEDHAALRDWNLEASENGTDWAALLRHRRDPSLRGAFAKANFPVESFGRSYRFFRIIIEGPNHAGTSHYHIEISGIEFYGHVRMVEKAQAPAA